MLTRENIYDILSEIPDPEIPVINIRELGILRDVVTSGDDCQITITPTYSGCPAMNIIEDDIRKKLLQAGMKNIDIKTVYSPAWTTDWLTPDVKQKFTEYGIVPPKTLIEIDLLGEKPEIIVCPNCGSNHTEEISHYGSTACKSLYRCLNCKEPFDHFKSL
jgi:ring-1,2-phenylacetyl-CoA epoxidase subunit PaaD